MKIIACPSVCIIRLIRIKIIKRWDENRSKLRKTTGTVGQAELVSHMPDVGLEPT